MMYRTTVVLALSVIAWQCGAGAKPAPVVKPAVNEVKTQVPQGQIRAELRNREIAHPALVDFQDLEGWTVAAFDGIEVELERSHEQVLWGQYAAKLTYQEGRPAARFEVRPPHPIPIPGRFTGIDLWVWGTGQQRYYPSELAVWVEDSEGSRHRIKLGGRIGSTWFLMHTTVASPDGSSLNYSTEGSAQPRPIAYPAKLVAAEVFQSRKPPQPHILYLGALSFYEIDCPALDLPPLPDNLHNQPWPTRPETILPSFKGEVRTSIVADGQGYRFEAQGPEETVAYNYVPATGTLSDVTVECGGQRFRPMFEGGICLEGEGKEGLAGKRLPVELVTCRLAREAVTVTWRLQGSGPPVEYSFTFRLWGKSLVVDAASAGTSATEFRFGAADGVEAPKLVQVPYLNASGTDMRVLCTGRLFVFGMLDWYNTDASEPIMQSGILGDQRAAYNGGAIYKKKTDRQRNPLRERAFVTVSSDFHEVLPNIPNPKIDLTDIRRTHLWEFTRGGLPAPDDARRYKSLGMDNLVLSTHSRVWPEGNRFFSQVEADLQVSDQAVIEFSRLLKGLGHTYSLYTDFCDMPPLNPCWDEQYVTLASDGSWAPAWRGTYNPKALYAVRCEARNAPILHEKFGTGAVYCDVHTAVPPWWKVDYDARVSGAGTYRARYEAWAHLVANEARVHGGMCVSEGGAHWMYAGLCDSFGLWRGDGLAVWLRPHLVDFDLLKIHPLSVSVSMCLARAYYAQKPLPQRIREIRSEWFARFHTAVMAFGHVGYLDEWGSASSDDRRRLEGAFKTYYTLAAIQPRYALVPVESISYFDGEKLLSTSDAIRSDAYLRNQIHVTYENDLAFWGNLNLQGKGWSVELNGEQYLLPPGGMLAYQPDELLQYMAIVDGQRVDYVRSPEYRYVDTHDHLLRSVDLTTRGAVAIKSDGERGWWIIPGLSCEDVTLSLASLGVDRQAQFSATAYAPQEHQMGAAEVRVGSGEVTVMPVAAALKYRLTAAAEGGGELQIAPMPAAPEALIGMQIPVTVSVTNTTGQPLRGLVAQCQAAASEVAESMQSAAALEPGQTVQATLAALVPTDTAPGNRCWFKVSVTGQAADRQVTGHAWFDVTAHSVIDVSVAPDSGFVEPGSRQRLAVKLSSNLAEPATASVAWRGPAAMAIERAQQQVELQPGEPATLALEFTAPGDAAVAPLELVVGVLGTEVVVRRWLKTESSEYLVQELWSGDQIAYGQTLRDGREEPLEGIRGQGAFSPSSGGALIDGLGLPGFRSVPPSLGTVHATIPIHLPQAPSELHFRLGFTSATRDGCVFQVQVIDGEEVETVFSQHYADLDKWLPCVADLSKWAGRKVKLKLIADPGPANDRARDVAAWGEPRVIVPGKWLRLNILDSQPGQEGETTAP